MQLKISYSAEFDIKLDFLLMVSRYASLYLELHDI
jgi:hypothetical protein